MKFEEIKSAEELIKYLNDSSNRLKSCDYISHYTTFPSLVKILNNKTLLLSNAKDMNDKLEYLNGDEAIWNKTYFACFMMSKKDSMAMWSVYSSPWKDGVKIAFPKSKLNEWIDKLDYIIAIDENNKMINEIPIDNKMEISISAVAYSNSDSRNIKSEKEIITWNSVKNEVSFDLKNHFLTGYIKNEAWSYEKEIRIKAMFDEEIHFPKLALPLDEIISDIKLITGPLFEGSLQSKLSRAVEGFNEDDYSFDQSIYSNLLNNID